MAGLSTPAESPHAAVAPGAAARGRSFLSNNGLFYGLLALTALFTLYTIHFIAYRTPVEATMGIVQKIFYFHVPAAYAMYVGAAACLIGSAGYLYSGNRAWDSLA